MADMQMPQMISLSLDEIRTIKHAVSKEAPYAERMSLGFVYRLLEIKERLSEDHIVLRELDELEGIAEGSSSKRAEQFKRAPLYPFWHKHFCAPRHLWKNVGVRWGIENQGNNDLTNMILSVAAEHGSNPDLWQKLLAYRFVIGGIEERTAAKRMTGDWIIFAKYNGKNFYLDLATHEEGRHGSNLLNKLRNGSAAEFPFLFENI